MDKLKLANKLNEQIDELSGFISIIESGKKYDERYKKQNSFYNMNIGAYICTGSDSPRYDKSIKDNEIITAFVEAGVSTLIRILDDKKNKLEELFK